ncbi:aldehyde dehydrogenase family protein [Sphaerisporangium album]|uniref:Aldehyde dehydrogenase family protein n=2 Tax=Sphaerisporangium album TaxID=509200 RepID=A0A367FLS1_9ACTN|nr:aldehyde dehydrogenase family protein [Sphaerisporangium album]
MAIDVILRRRDDLRRILLEVATHAAAEDEIHRSVRALAGARWETIRNRPPHIGSLAVFMPSNNVLYSYVLYALIPALYTGSVTFRPSSRVEKVTEAVHRLLSEDPIMPNPFPVDMAPVSQRRFLSDCRTADAMVFCGRPENARSVSRAVGPATLLLTFGSGPNPVVVGPDADLSRVVPDLLSTRLYNSGQDCLSPDVIFVHRSLAGPLTERLDAALARLAAGERQDPRAEVSPLVYRDAVQGAAAFFAASPASDVVRGGGTDIATGWVEPTLLFREWDATFHPPEFFAPVFCVMEYESLRQVGDWLDSPEERGRGMYVSLYGMPAETGRLMGTSVVLRDRTTFDAEDGNRPFGGYGADASSVHASGRSHARPLLLSAELARRAV